MRQVASAAILLSGFLSGCESPHSVPPHSPLATLHVLAAPSVSGAVDHSATPATVESVLTNARPGDRVLLAAGVYESKRIWIQKPLMLVGAGRGATVIQNGFRAWSGAGPTGIRVDVGSVTISDLTIRNISTEKNEAYFGILVDVNSAMSNVTINNVEVTQINWSAPSWSSGNTGNAIGIKVSSRNAANALDRLTISNCYVHDCKLGYGEAVSLGGKVTNFAVTNNVIERVDNIGIDAVGGYTWFNGTASDGAISNNVVRAVDSATNPAYRGSRAAAGIYVDGGQRITVAENTIDACNFGISISSENPGTSARFNQILRNTITEPTEFAFNVGGDTGTSGTGFAFENVFTGNKVTGSPNQAMVLFGRTRAYLPGSKPNDWNSNTFTWKAKPDNKSWWTTPDGDIDLGDIQTDTTNTQSVVP